jgi:hypothetical protein
MFSFNFKKTTCSSYNNRITLIFLAHVATHMMHMPSHNKITKKETVICEKINLDG